MYIIESKYKDPDKFIRQLKFRIKRISKALQTLVDLKTDGINKEK